LFFFALCSLLTKTNKPNKKSNQRTSSNLKKQDSLEKIETVDRPLTKEAITLSNSSLKPANSLNTVQHSTPQTKNTINIDASPIRKHSEPTDSTRAASDSLINSESRIDESQDQSKCEEKSENDTKKYVKKITIKKN